MSTRLEEDSPSTRLEGSPSDAAGEPLLSASSETSFRQLSFHRFADGGLEREFTSYVHPKLLFIFPVIYTLAALLSLQLLFTNADGPIYNIGMYVTTAVVSVVLRIVAWRRGRTDAILLSIERWMFIGTVTVSITIDLVVSLWRFRSCDGPEGLVGDRRKAFLDSQCRKWWSPLCVIFISAFSMVPIVRTLEVAMVATYAVVLHLTIWVLIPPPDMLFQVWLFAVYVAAGVLFITFVRYDQEKVQRQQFLKRHELVQQQQKVTQSEAELRKFASQILPEAFLQRFARVSSESATVDKTSNGVVLLAGVHDFVRWSATQIPIESASAVVFFQSHMRTLSKKHGLDFIGTQGDTIVSTGNLVQPMLNVRQRAITVAHDILHICSVNTLFPPIRGSVALGALSGAFVGSSHVRYDVFGPCVEAAQVALLECPCNKVVVVVVEAEPDDEGITTQLSGAGPSSSSDGQSFKSSASSTSSREVLNLDDLKLIASRVPSESGDNSQREPSSGLTDPIIELAFASASGHSLLHAAGSSGDVATSESLAKKCDELHLKLQRYEEETTVWCCFPRFVDDEVESAYVAERMHALPGSASRAWLAYACYTAVMMGLLLADLHEPQGSIGIVLLSLAFVLAIVMAALPHMVSEARMASYFFGWSVLGIALPLLVVFGCAASRPSAIGVDPRVFLFVGALVRSYCFTSSRWQSVFVPIFAVVGMCEYLLPGGQLRLSVGIVLFGILFNLIADRQREGLVRNNVRRRVQQEFVLAKLQATESMRNGLLQSAIPGQLLSLVSSVKETTATQLNGVAVAIRATPSRRHAESARDKQLLQDHMGSRFDLLEALLSQTQSLAVGSILGDQAVVVGPVTLSPETMDPHAERNGIIEGIWLARGLVDANDAIQTKPSPFRFGVLVDSDSIVHALETGEVSQYWALGVAVTRLVSFMAATDATTHDGCYVTERVVQSGNALGSFDDTELTDTGPMRLRGLGMIRLSKVQRRALPLDKS